MSGNSIGRLFTVTTFGESHGPALGCIVDGCPPGLELTEADLQGDVDRRRTGTSQFVSQRKEGDEVKILSGVFEGKTTGTAIGILIENTDARSRDYEKIKDRFRPGHADYTYQQKYGFRDYRGGGRSSARETVMRVAAGAIARKYLHTRLGVSISGYLSQIGSLTIDPVNPEAAYDNPFFCPDPVAHAGARRPHVEDPRRGRFARREGHGAGARRAAGPGRAGVRPARCRPRARHDGHQRGEGRGDRRRRGFGRAARQRAPRRAHAHGFPEQQRRWHPRRHLVGAGRRRARHVQAHLEHPGAGQDHRRRGQSRGSRHHRPARSLRGPARHAHLRSHAGHRAHGPLPAASRPERRRALVTPVITGKGS